MRWIIQHKTISFILFLILFGILPIVINILCQIQAPSEILEEPSNWLLFWGTYAAAIASFGMILITSISLYSTKQQQLNTIRYQSKLDWINQLKPILVDVVDSLDEDIMNDFLREFNNISDTPDFSEIFLSSNAKLKKAKYALRTHLMGCNDSIMTEFYQVFRKMEFDYITYLDEIAFVLKFKDGFKNPEGIPNVEYFKQQLDIFKKKCPHIKDKPNPDKIWKIAELYDYKLISKRDDILHALHFYADTHSFRMQCEYVIKEEYKIADSILNGTEQNK